MPIKVLSPRKRRQREDTKSSLKPSDDHPWLPWSLRAACLGQTGKAHAALSHGSRQKASAWQSPPQCLSQENKPTPAWFLTPGPEAEFTSMKGHSRGREIPGTLAWLRGLGGDPEITIHPLANLEADSRGWTQSWGLTPRVGCRRAEGGMTFVSRTGVACQLEEDLGSQKPSVALLATPSPSRSLACLLSFTVLTISGHVPWWEK